MKELNITVVSSGVSTTHIRILSEVYLSFFEVDHLLQRLGDKWIRVGPFLITNIISKWIKVGYMYRKK